MIPPGVGRLTPSVGVVDFAVTSLLCAAEKQTRRDARSRSTGGSVAAHRDILTYDVTYRQHLAHVIDIVRRCEASGITLNPEKFQFARQEVDYCGYRVTPTGYTSDGEKLRAIAEFPRPSNITDLRSFLGLANQLGPFSSELADAASPLRDLLKKGRIWCWTPNHENAFRDVKRVLSAPPVMAYFDPKLPTMLQTDASSTRGMGFALLQRRDDVWRLVHCGSRFLTDVETR